MGWITVNEAAEIVGVTPVRVRIYLRENRIKSKKFGRAWMVDERSARAFEPKPEGRPKGK